MTIRNDFLIIVFNPFPREFFLLRLIDLNYTKWDARCSRNV